MKTGRCATRLGYPVLGMLALTIGSASHARAEGDQVHAHDSAARQRSALVNVIRESTARFQDVQVAEAEGYTLMFGCVSGPDSGAMGLHYVDPSLIGDDIVDPTRPEIVIYEPLPNGRKRLIGADFLILKDVWDAAHSSPPELMGQLFHLFEAPNRFGLPAFYTLHVWAWKENPTGTFVNWHSRVSCDAFNPQ
jgi:hypothetical protein